MFRAFFTEGADNPLSEEEILSHTRRNDLLSFAKTEAGVDGWIEQLGDLDGSETQTITMQTGKGYDVQKIYRYLRQYSQADLDQAAGEPANLHNLKRAGGLSQDSQAFGTTVLEVVAYLNKSLEVVDVRSIDVDEYYEDD